MAEIEWQDPPRNTRRKFNWSAIASELERRPGEWARIGREVNVGNSRTARAHGLEARTVSAGLDYKLGDCDLYVRWPAGGES